VPPRAAAISRQTGPFVVSTKRSRDSSQILHVDERLAGSTLAAVVKSAQPGLSWNAARQLVTSRHVMVDGNLCLDVGRRLKAGEVVKLFRESRAPLPGMSDIRIVHVDSELVVVVKPSGMNSVRHEEERHWNARRKQHQPTLDELLPELLARQAPAQPLRRAAAAPSRRRQTPPAAGSSVGRGVLPVHRLDRETSGLMVSPATKRLRRT
jgi:23S rRNA pseudouridine1911/1915/1917 synthase